MLKWKRFSPHQRWGDKLIGIQWKSTHQAQKGIVWCHSKQNSWYREWTGRFGGDGGTKSINEQWSEEYQRTTERRVSTNDEAALEIERVGRGRGKWNGKRKKRGVKLSKKYGYILINNEERNGVPAIHTLSDASPFKRDMIFTLDMEKNEKLVQQKVTDPRSTNPEKNAEKSKYF